MSINNAVNQNAILNVLNGTTRGDLAYKDGSYPLMSAGNLTVDESSIITQAFCSRMCAGFENEIKGGTGKLKSVKGFSVRQLVKNGNFASLDGWSALGGAQISKNNGYCLMQAYAVGDGISTSVNLDGGKTYYIRCNVHVRIDTSSRLYTLSLVNGATVLYTFSTTIDYCSQYVTFKYTPQSKVSATLIISDSRNNGSVNASRLLIGSVEVFDLSSCGADYQGNLVSVKTAVELDALFGTHAHGYGVSSAYASTLKTTGKNLLDSSVLLSLGFAAGENGEYICSSPGSVMGKVVWKNVGYSGRMTFGVKCKWGNTNGGAALVVSYTDGTVITWALGEIDFSETVYCTAEGKTVLEIGLGYGATGAMLPTVMKDLFVYLGVFENASYLPYESCALSLPQGYTLSGINGFADEIDFDGGVYRKRIAKRALSTLGFSYANGEVTSQSLSPSIYAADGGLQCYLLADVFSTGSAAEYQNQACSAYCDYQTGIIKVRVSDFGYQNLADFLADLGSTYVYYVADSETSETFSDSGTFTCDNYGLEEWQGSPLALLTCAQYTADLKRQIITNGKNTVDLLSAVGAPNIESFFKCLNQLIDEKISAALANL